MTILYTKAREMFGKDEENRQTHEEQRVTKIPKQKLWIFKKKAK
ncbi:hypothetical protein [Alteribacillus sp. HJP-4]